MNNTTRVVLRHGGLFLLTLITTTLAGAELTNGKSIFSGEYSWADFFSGMSYSIPFLFILSVHEFGHYFAARYHHVPVTLPYYIPMPWFLFPLGTLGALIRIKPPFVTQEDGKVVIKGGVVSKLQHFDIGIAGPLAGFIAAVGVLWYGFTHLPPPEYIFQIHPEYQKYGLDYAAHVYQPEAMKGVLDLHIGKSLLYAFLEKVLGDPSRIPNPHEVMHYPFLFAGFFSLVFTSINLLPVGQLDGGHILYGLVGFRMHRIVASGVFLAFLFFAVLGLVSPADPRDELMWEIPLMVGFLFMCLTGMGWKRWDTLLTAVAMFTVQYLIVLLFPHVHGYPTWLLFAFMIGRLIGVQHPPAQIEEPLDPTRKALGWLALVIFIICFSPNPL
jgi:membrane-associated protease RseP (regulator of RpoE activity)